MVAQGTLGRLDLPNPVSSHKFTQIRDGAAQDAANQGGDRSGKHRTRDKFGFMNDGSKKEIYITKFLLDCELVSKPEADPQPASASGVDISKCILFASSNKGFIYVFDLRLVLKDIEIPFVANSNTRLNYNAFRTISVDFDSEVQKLRINTTKVIKISEAKPRLSSQLSLRHDKSPTRKGLQKLHHFENSLLLKYHAHKDLLTSLQLITLHNTYLLTSSIDGYIKIWDILTAQLLCSLNINHPLPIKWDIPLDGEQYNTEKIMYALRILDIICKKYKLEISYMEEKKLKIQEFLHFITTKLTGQQQQ